MSRDRYQPSDATPEGQMLSLAGGLGRFGRRGRILATIWLAGMLIVGIVIAISVLSST